MPPLKTVVVVFKTHFDLGFTDLPDRVMAAYTGPMFEAVQAVMTATAHEAPGARYVWTLPAWPLRYLLDSPSVPPAHRAAADALVRAGRLTWHAYPFTTHTAFCGLEDLVRGLDVARELEDRYARRVTGAKQTDVPGHTWILPTLLARAGIRFLHLGCNSGSAAPWLPRLFFWEGPDGSRVLTYYSPGGYGTPLLPPSDWPLDTWLALQQTLDNHGPHRPEELVAMRAEVAAASPGTRVVFGELGDFADAVFANPAQLAAVPVISWDLADTWIHGVGTMPREVARVRALRGRLAATESLGTLQRPERTAVESPLTGPAARAYEQLLLFGEHTWGLDVKSTITRVFTAGEFAAARETAPYRRLEELWVAKGAYVTQAEAAQAVAAALVAGGATGAAPGPARLYEPLGWGRAGRVEAVWADGSALPSGPVEVTVAGGPPVAGEVHDGRLRFPGTTAPLSLGSIVVRPRPEGPAVPEPAGTPVLENAYFRLAADPEAGGLTSLVEKASGHEWVAANPAGPFGAYRYDLFSAADIAAFLRAYGRLFQDWFIADFGRPGYPEDWPHLTAWAGGYRAALTRGPGRQTLLLTGGRLRPERAGPTVAPAQTIDLAISLYDDLPVVDFTYHVRGKAATPLAEGATAVFPLNLTRPTFRIGQTGAVIDPARDIAPGANRSLWAVETWVDVTDDRHGLGIIPIDAPLVSLGSLGLFEYLPERVPAAPVVFGHLFNTQWGTNFPQWQEGDFAFRYRLVPHAGDWRTSRLWQIAWETTRPALLWPAGAAAPAAGLATSDGLIVLAVKPRRDAPGIVVRVWDALGLARRATITVAGPVAEVRRTDLLERPGDPLPFARTDAGAMVPLAIAPHAVETVAIGWQEAPQV